MALENTHPNFQAKIGRIADVAKLSPGDVYGLWCKYSKQCSDADQSAVMEDFVQWYSEALGGDRSVLNKAIH